MNKYRGMRAYFIILLILLMRFPHHAFGQGIPDEARRYMARGVAAVEMAKSASDLNLAAIEFEQAAKLAPDWPDIYYNLGSVQAKAGNFASAINSFQRYLDLAPKSPDAAKVQEEIFKLEYRRDREKLATTLAGTWAGPNKQTFEVKLEGSRLTVTRRTRLGDDMSGDDTIVIKSMGTRTGPMTDMPLVFSGTLVGDKISGQYLQAAGKSSTYCDMPERKGNFEGAVDVAAG